MQMDNLVNTLPFYLKEEEDSRLPTERLDDQGTDNHQSFEANLEEFTNITIMFPNLVNEIHSLPNQR
jgi:hypothetical protein